MYRQSLQESAYSHFAVIYIDPDGYLCWSSSDSIAESCQTILTPTVAGEFLKAVAMSSESSPSQYPRESQLHQKCMAKLTLGSQSESTGKF